MSPEYQKHAPESQKNNVEKVSDGVYRVATPEGQFRILYGNHVSLQPAEGLGDNYSGLAIEAMDWYPAYAEAQKTLGALFIDGDKDIQYGDLYKRCACEKKPIYLVDVNETKLAQILYWGGTTLESLFGYSLIRGKKKKIKEPPPTTSTPPTRREFLQNAGKILAGSYLLSGIAPAIGALTSKEILRGTSKVHEKMHPETTALAVTLRNYIMAQKMATIKNREASGREQASQELALVIGGEHSGVEEALTDTAAERTKVLKKILSLPGMEEEFENAAKIARLDYDDKEKKWRFTEVFDDPVLTTLEAEIKK